MVDKNAVNQVLETLKPLFDAHNGTFELVDISDDGTVTVKLVGQCEICSLKAQTSQALKIMLDAANAGVTKIEAL